ncbi:MAG: VIT and VWA domain-containing protein [Fimbriimonadaceae bacterium]|nr:VIT and VWA domain-containing protein [Fimbriimonadaceae bacterium]
MIGLTVAMLTLAGGPDWKTHPQAPSPRAAQEDAAPGQLTIVDKTGRPTILCPLKGTKVDAEITGFGARVTVVQTFTNPTKSPIEAVYTFPLPADAGVDRMRMQVGSRIIEGEIKKREEARQIYEAAKNAGQVASLLDQERPNIFTQSVANVMPGAQIRVEVSYVQLLKYEEGQFEFSYPMVVGPRFMPATTPDPGKIAPAYVPKGTRSGATIDLNVRVNAGAPIQTISSVLHEVSQRIGPNACTVTLAKKDEIPNKDFILRYGVATDTIQDALLTHWDPKRGGTFTLVLMPPKVVKPEAVKPKEVIFVVDQSGSQNGFPIEKSRELTLKLLKRLNPDDTFNVMGFSNTVNPLWPEPRQASDAAVQEAEAFVKGLNANGGTQLLTAVQAALGVPEDRSRLRLVVFNTDGFVGNDFEILDEIQKKIGFARMFTFGIGNGVNRFLIDAMSAEGKGDSEIVTLAEAADPAVERFIRRTQNPILTGITVDVDGVTVSDMLPKAIPDVFSEKPVVIKGRYTRPGSGTLTIRGTLGQEEWSKQIDLILSDQATSGSAIATLWARSKVDELMRSNWREAAKLTPEGRKVNEDKIVAVALDYGLMTQYTSFVAVEKKVVNVGGKQRTVAVPVDMTDGVNFQEDGNLRFRSAGRAPGAPGGGRGGSIGGLGGGGGGFGGGSGAPPATAGKATNLGVAAGEKKDGETGANRPLTADEKRKLLYESKVSSKLRDSKLATVEVQVKLTDTSKKALDRLKALGLKIDVTDAGLKIVFGTISQKKLIDLAQEDFVRSVLPI